MPLAPQHPQARVPSSNATTTTTTATNPHTSAPVLRLRATGSPPASSRRIQWAEDVVDNEGLGRKRSKVCCIYHAPHPVGESSDDSSSDSDSDSDNVSNAGAGDDGRARMGGKAKEKAGHEHGDGGHDGCEHEHGGGGGAKGKRREKRRNAYETEPKYGNAGAAEVKT